MLSYLTKNSNIPFPQKISIMKDVAAGMNHLSSQGIIHRDLAARNVLLDYGLRAKVSDFGLSKYMGVENANASYTTNSDMLPLKW